MSLDDKILPWRFQIESPRTISPWIGTSVEKSAPNSVPWSMIKTSTASLCLSQNYRNVEKVSVAVTSCLRAPWW